MRCAGPHIRGDGQALAVRDACVDVVMAGFSIHLAADPARAVHEASRVLVSGGALGIEIGAGTPSTAVELMVSVLAPHVSADRVPLLPKLTLFHPPAVLEAAGFVDIDTRTVDVHLPVPDAATFIAGERSHGMRSLFEQIPEDARAAVEAEAEAKLDEAFPGGTLTLDRSALFVRARKR
jgi:hypothetical protein